MATSIKTINARLSDKLIDIKTKKYSLVSDRILAFAEYFPNGSIVTEILSGLSDKMVVVKATVTPDVTDPSRIFVGHSQAMWGDGLINRAAALENAETSAWGRALAAMGIGVIESIASMDEVNKAELSEEARKVIDNAERQVVQARDAAKMAGGGL